MKRVLFFSITGGLILAIPVLLYAMANVGVSVQYETKDSSDCISLVTGENFCHTFKTLKILLTGTVLLLAGLLVFRKRMLGSGSHQTN